ncbi:MAG: acyltransferase family protein [Bacteroidia bacterium]
MKKLAYIDALRGFAVVLVIIVHSSQCGINNYGDVINRILSKAHYGVQLFYIASAFTIFLSYSNRINKEHSPAKNFFLRRFFRIAPMFYITIIYYSWQSNSWSDDFPDTYYSSTLSHIFFLHGLSPYWINSIVPGGWSIAVEMLFYLLIPFLFYHIQNLNASIIFFLISLLFQYTINTFFIHFPLIENEDVWRNFLYYYFPNQLPVFALGIILFHWIQNKNAVFNTEPLILLLISILVFTQFYLEIIFIPNFIFISAGFVLFAYYLSTQKNSFFVNPVITFIGKVSYSMYLIHFAVLEFMIRLGVTDIFNNGNHYTLNFILRLCIVTIVTLTISTIFYYTVEKPMQKVGSKIIERLENRQIFSRKTL